MTGTLSGAGTEVPLCYMPDRGALRFVWLLVVKANDAHLRMICSLLRYKSLCCRKAPVVNTSSVSFPVSTFYSIESDFVSVLTVKYKWLRAVLESCISIANI